MRCDAFRDESPSSSYRCEVLAHPWGMEAGAVCEPSGYPPGGRGRPNGLRYERALLDRKHSVERDLRPVLLVVGHADAVMNLAGNEAFERPQQMVGRDAEHRRAEAAKLID